MNATLSRPTATLDGQALKMAVVLAADPPREKIAQMQPVAGN